MEEIASVPRRSSSLSAKGIGGWRANSNLENSDGGISDEYSDDDDPGYRIVLVEDVGELYPDVSYRLRNRIPDPVQTPSASNPDLSRTKDVEDNGDGDDDDDDEDGSEGDEAGDASSDIEDELAQRLNKLSPNDPDTLTRLPVRVSPASHDKTDRTEASPPASGEVEALPAEPMLAWGDPETDKSGKAKPSSTPPASLATEKKGKSVEKKAKDIKGKTEDVKKDSRGEEGKHTKKDNAHATAKTEEKKASIDSELDTEAGVDAEELAAHHMPDLIEGHQPMFNPSSSSTTATASTTTPSSAAKQKNNGPTGSEASSQPAAPALAAPAPAASNVPLPPAPPASLDEASAAASTASVPASIAPKDDTSSEKTVPEPSDETVYYDCFDLKIVYERNRTGFEETKDFPIEINGVIAGRYQILEFLGAAAFSKAVQCVDLTDGSYVCIKIIKNNKDFFDQSLDEIKILKYLNAHDTRDDHHLLQLYDYFYFKEHLFIVTELLRDNLYEFSKFNRESGAENYFTLARLQKITRECLEGLKFVHELRLIHCDLKPENILIRSYSRCEIKIIDFGSSCFVTDHLTSYVQSRSYRAPEVILGLPYDELIDMWSLGCILAELWTGRVLFQNDSLATLLARVVGILGGIDEDMLLKVHTPAFISKFERYLQHALFAKQP